MILEGFHKVLFQSYTGYIYICISRTQHDPCFYWKGLCFERLKPKNRGHLQVPGIYYTYIFLGVNDDNHPQKVKVEIKMLTFGSS